MSSDVDFLPSSTSWEDERIVSNRQALDEELARRKTGGPISVADVYYSSMPHEMEQEACQLAATAMESFNTEQEIAQFVKESFDGLYGKAWQCICGKHFGSYVTFQPDSFIYFRFGTTAFMLFRAIEVKHPEYEQELELNEEIKKQTDQE